jgi:osmotically-inducible protein OsmY
VLAQEGPGEPTPSVTPSSEMDRNVGANSAEGMTSELKGEADSAVHKAAAATKRAFDKVRAEVEDSLLTARAKVALVEDDQTKKSTIHVSTTSGLVTVLG